VPATRGNQPSAVTGIRYSAGIQILNSPETSSLPSPFQANFVPETYILPSAYCVSDSEVAGRGDVFLVILYFDLTFSFPWIRPLIPLFVVPVPATHMRPFCSRLGPFAYLIFMPLDPAPTPPSIEHHSTSMTAYTTWDIVEYIFEYHVTHRWHRPTGPRRVVFGLPALVSFVHILFNMASERADSRSRSLLYLSRRPTTTISPVQLSFPFCFVCDNRPRTIPPYSPFSLFLGILSPSHLPTLWPAPANVERLMTSVRKHGLRVAVDIIEPYRLSISRHRVNPLEFPVSRRGMGTGTHVCHAQHYMYQILTHQMKYMNAAIGRAQIWPSLVHRTRVSLLIASWRLSANASQYLSDQ
jgi:hypothetical protein